MRVAVLGATGALGRHVVPGLIERGDVVIAVRHRRPAPWLDALGCESRAADILDAETLTPAIDGCDAVMHLATAIPPAGAAPDWARNDRVRRDGTLGLIAACRAVGVRRYVQQSIAMLCAGHADQWIDEQTPVAPNRVTESAADMERLVRGSGLDYRILRGGLFYGGGCGTEDRWRSAARRDELEIPGDGSSYLSLVHVSDMAQAVVQALHASTGHLLVNIVDDHPVTYRELYRYMAAAEGASPPRDGMPQTFASFRVRNTLAKQLLDWRPHYVSWRAGLA